MASSLALSCSKPNWLPLRECSYPPAAETVAAHEVVGDTTRAWGEAVPVNGACVLCITTEGMVAERPHNRRCVSVGRENPDGVLALDNGDTFHGTYPAVTTRGEGLIPLLNALKLDAMTAH